MSGVLVLPEYASITFVAEVCKPWIELWGGDEWGESMFNLYGACHTDYGFSDEDCALFASKLFENLNFQLEWVLDEGHLYGFWEDEELDRVEQECRDIRSYWLNGGNLTGHEESIKAVKVALADMPGWVFGEPRPKARNE